MSWQEIVAAAMERYGMLSAGRRIGVAVSGGADSVFLLHALQEFGLAACILHVNHRLRGAESDQDEAFVRYLAASSGLPIHAATLPPREGNIEQEARRARYSFFAEMIGAGCCDRVATGHTLDDQAETVLSRFLRGAGTAGLSGIRPVTRTGMIRPLLELRRDDIRNWLAQRGIAWQQDCSNLDVEFQRNRIRLDLMPHLAASLNPALPEVLASTADWACAEEDYWIGELDRIEPRYLTFAPESVLILTGQFLELPVAVQRRLLRRAIERVRGSLRSIDFRHVERIRRMMTSREGSGRVQLPDLDIYRSFDWLRLAPVGVDSRLERDFEVELRVPGVTEIAERLLKIEVDPVTNLAVYNGWSDALDGEKCAGVLLLRNWRPGDRYRPIGRTSAEKIKTLFQEVRVPLWQRRNWPVIARGNAIVWARRFGVAEEFAGGPEGRQILRIRELGESNRPLSTSIESESAQTQSVLCGSGIGLKRAAGCPHSSSASLEPGGGGAEVL